MLSPEGKQLNSFGLSTISNDRGDYKNDDGNTDDDEYDDHILYFVVAHFQARRTYHSFHKLLK